MRRFYVDDSVHDKAGFVLGAFVYTEDEPSESIAHILTSNGYNPDKVEFKSGISFTKNPSMAKVREELRDILLETCKIGVTVVPRRRREELGIECLNALKQFIYHNKLNASVKVYFEEGLFTSSSKAAALAKERNLDNCELYFEQNSGVVRGIQLADLVAHTLSIILKGKLGLIQKTVKVGKNSGYDPEMEIELDWVMVNSVRYAFFNEGAKRATDDNVLDAILQVEPYGLYVSDLCNANLQEKVREAFGYVYLGCIH